MCLFVDVYVRLVAVYHTVLTDHSTLLLWLGYKRLKCVLGLNVS